VQSLVCSKTLYNLEVRGTRPTRGTQVLLGAALGLDPDEIWPAPEGELAPFNENEREDQSRSISKLAAAGGRDEAYP
jgi:hypothetical protein